MSHTPHAAVKEFLMTWKIRNFQYAFRDIISEPFVSRIFENTQFYLIIGREGTQHDDKIRISIATSNKNLPSLDYNVALVTLDGLPEISLKEEAVEFKANKFPLAKFDKWIKNALIVPEKTIFQDRRKAILPHDQLTIQFRLQQRGVENPESEESFISSSIGVRQKLYFWTLNQFSNGWKDMHASIVTSWGKFGNFHLKASLKQEGEENIVIEVLRDKGDAIRSTMKMSLLAAHGAERKLAREAFMFEKSDQEQVWQSPPLIAKNELVAAKNLLLTNDALSLKCEFTASLGIINESEIIDNPGEFNSLPSGSRCPSSEENGKLPSGSLQSDFKGILDTGSLSDLKLKVDSDIFPVHKAVLGARSPVFNAMFTHNFKENSNGQVLIDDFNADTIRRLLIYLYTDTIDCLTMEKAINLYIAADKYKVSCLQDICASFLKANLSSPIACTILNLADQLNDKELKVVAQDFIGRHDSEILDSNDWKDLEKSNHPLVVETWRKIYQNKLAK